MLHETWCKLYHQGIVMYKNAMKLKMDKELKFIHITKTGGDALCSAAKKFRQILWGSHDPEYGIHSGEWHHFFPNKKQSLKEKYNWFMVVRNPYDRIISEIHWIIASYFRNQYMLGKIKKITKLEQWSVEELNTTIVEWITLFTQKLEKDGGHFSPMHKYLDENIPIHIIKYETLKQDLPKLLKKFEIKPFKIPLQNVTEKKFTVEQLSRQTKDYINYFYQKDFEIFNYEQT